MSEFSGNDQERLNMITINEQQRLYYEDSGEEIDDNLISRVWDHARGSMMKVRRELEITSHLVELHKQWLGDLNGKRVLDLGCASGNLLSLYLASNAGSYLGIDLSESATARLRRTLAKHELTNATVESLDFLSSDFPYEKFDIIYAYSVMHHFKHFEAFLKVLNERLVPNGRVITMDPTQTSLSMRILRKLYRPFQINAGWEWPLSRKSFLEVEQFFHIEAIQGFMGYAKIAIPLSVLPYASSLATRLGKRLHMRDLHEANCKGRGLWRCMQVAMHLRKRDMV